MLRIRIGQLDDPMLRNQRLQEELEQALAVLLPERARAPKGAFHAKFRDFRVKGPISGPSKADLSEIT